MAYKADEVKVGFVIVLSLLILAGFIIAIIGLRIGQPMVSYSTELKYVADVDSGRPVRFGGLDVGKVSKVGISPKNNALIEIVMEVEKGTPIKTDSVAFINFIGFVGDYYLEISTGTEGAQLLPPGSEITGQNVTTFNELIAQVQSAVEKLNESLEIINEKVLSQGLPDLKNQVTKTTETMNKLLEDLDKLVTENRAQIHLAITEIGDLVQENRKDVRATVENFRTAAAKLNELADSLNSVVAENRGEINTVVKTLRDTAAEAEAAAEKVNTLISQNADEINTTMQNLESTSANFRDLSEELSEQPWRLLWRTRAPRKQEIQE